MLTILYMYETHAVTQVRRNTSSPKTKRTEEERHDSTFPPPVIRAPTDISESVPATKTDRDLQSSVPSSVPEFHSPPERQLLSTCHSTKAQARANPDAPMLEHAQLIKVSCPECKTRGRFRLIPPPCKTSQHWRCRQATLCRDKQRRGETRTTFEVG